MQKLQLADFASEAGVGEKNTVSNGPDNNANNLMAARFWNCGRHGTTQQAVDFGLALVAATSGQDGPGALSAGAMNIGGHGNEGSLETGKGQTGPYNESTFIYFFNEHNWGPQLDRLKPTPITLLSIWSCHTGAGQDGADMLYKMAVRCGRAVRARTGFTFVNDSNIWFENNSVWQVATPSNKPAPIEAPTQHFTPATIVFEVGGTHTAADSLASLTIEPTNLANVRGAPKSVSSAAAAQFVKELFVPSAMDMDVAIMAFITAQITLKFNGGATLAFDVYNDRLAVEKSSKTGYYLRGRLKALYDLL